MTEHTMPKHEVVIAGSGPTGMMLAGELALAGVDVAIVERRANQELAGSRAGGMSARTLEMLDQRGLAERFIAEGQIFQVTGFAVGRLDISDFPARRHYGLALWQNHIERIMAQWIAELPVTLYRSRDVVGFTQDDAGVNVQLSDNTMLRAQYLIGCDGGRSVVRKAAGIEFPGWDATTSSILAQVEMREEPPLGIHRTAVGVHSFGRRDYKIVDGQVVFADSGPVGVMVTDAEPVADSEPTFEELRQAVIALRGTDYGMHSPIWVSRFSDMSRQAATYRKGRVLLAGDAAHVHSPIGGHGMNTGMQDAMNLGWKLAQVVKGISAESLLDTYHDERHSVGARVLKSTMAQVALQRTDDRTSAVRDIMSELLKLDEPRKQIATEMSGLGIHYNLGEGHPLLGRRMPDLDITVGSDSVHAYSLLHNARAVLINFGEPLITDVTPWKDRVQFVNAIFGGKWELPAIGEVAAPSAVLVRPDGYVAWVGEGSEAGLREALTKWFGQGAAQ